jgi:hypothetical protein
LVISLPGVSDPLQKLYIDLKSVPRHRLLIALPAFLVSFIALISRQPVHLELIEDPPDARAAYVDIMIALEIDHDLPGAKVVGLPQIDDFGQYLRTGSPWAVDRSPRAIQKAGLSASGILFLPLVEGASADTKISAGFRDVMGYFLIMPENSQAPLLIPEGVILCHVAPPSSNGSSLSKRASGVNRVCQF